MLMRGMQAAKELGKPGKTANLRIVAIRWWQRWSDRRVPETAGENALSLAIRNGDPLPPIKRADIDEVDEFGMTALGWAAARAPRETITHLIDEGADPWFGDLCSTRTRNIGRYGAWGEDVMVTPLVIAIVNGRTDVAMEMLGKVPRKECGKASDHPSTLGRDRLVIEMVGTYAAAFGADNVHRFMISDFLDRVAAQNTSDGIGAYNAMVEYAWRKGLEDVFVNRPSGELLSARSFIRYMARFSSLAELRYWIDRLGLRQPEAVAEMAGALGFYRFGGRGLREDFSSKFEAVADLGAGFTPAQKQEIVRSIFKGYVFSNDDAGVKQATIETLKRHGFDLSDAIFVHPPTDLRRADVRP